MYCNNCGQSIWAHQNREECHRIFGFYGSCDNFEPYDIVKEEFEKLFEKFRVKE